MYAIRSYYEKIAEVIALEILFEQPYEIKDAERFIGLFGAFYPIFLTLRNLLSYLIGFFCGAFISWILSTLIFPLNFSA